MKRTRRLMAAVTTSLFFAGAAPGTPPAQTAPKQSERPKTDAEIKKAAGQIYDWLEGTSRTEAKTKDEIQQHFPAISPPLVESAIKYLRDEGGIRQLGEGTAASPFRYYEYDANATKAG
jgi:hypothetical protein